MPGSDDLSSLAREKRVTKAMIGLRDLLRRAVFTEFRTGHRLGSVVANSYHHVLRLSRRRLYH